MKLIVCESQEVLGIRSADHADATVYCDKNSASLLDEATIAAYQ